MNPLARMLADIIDYRLEGAACTGEHDLFDPRGENEPAEHHALRAEYARAICGACPVLHACHDTATNLSRHHRTGVWAGIYYDKQGRPWAEKDTPQ